jgi:CRISPR/Cas system-associated exonuclease Cas4 (RecB family)
MFGFNKHNFTLMIVPGNRVRIELKYNDAVYTERRIKEIADHWKQAVAVVLGNPAVQVGEM